MADEMINSYVALDLETTGIGARHEKITEIGMVKVIDGEMTDTYHTMVNPHREIPKNQHSVSFLCSEKSATSLATMTSPA